MQQDLRPLRVATLNFACPNTSPFEYHDGSTELSNLNKIFVRKLSCRQEFNVPKFSWDVGKIDVVMKKPRYCVLYSKDACTIDDRLVTHREFDVIWSYQYEKNRHILSEYTIKPAMVELTRVFDWLAYESVVELVYGIDAEKDEQILNVDVRPFREFLKRWHTKSYLQTKEKIKWVLNYIRAKTLDVMFLQEAGVVDWSLVLPADFSVIKNEDSVVIYRKATFAYPQQQFHKQLHEKYGKKLNFNSDTIYGLFGNYLLVAAHLSSKAHRFQQSKDCFNTLKNLLEQFPQVRLIMGMDANQPLNKIDSFSIFPVAKQFITTSKKRTNLQVQYHKADILDQETKDVIVTSMGLRDSRVETLLQKTCQDLLLPCEEHPFDHLAVSATIMQDVRPKKDSASVPQ